MNNTVVRIIRYIIKNNWPIMWLPKIGEAFFYQIFQRTSNSLLSKKLFNGKKIILFPKCNVSSLFIYSDFPDKKEIFLLRKMADKNTVFFDIGANIGSYSIMMADKVKDVYAFEPYPLSFERAKMNFLLNGMDESKVINKALSNVNSKVYFSDMKDNLTENKIVKTRCNSIMIEAVKLDDWIKNNKFNRRSKYLVKIDVEGHEKEVFEGGKKFFKNYPIIGIIFESFDSKILMKYLKDLDYRVKKISDNNYWAKKN